MAVNDLTAKTITSTGYVSGSSSNAKPARVKSIYYVASGTAGSIVLKDGGSGGTTLMTIATPASATATENVYIPEGGVRFRTDVHATLTNVTSLTVFHDG